MSHENIMFTYNEAIGLLQKSWGVKEIEERLKTDRRNLVDEIVQVIHEKVAFQSITLLAADMHHQPSFDEIKENCMSGVGGLCYQLAPFVFCLLKALGFCVQMVSSTVTSTMTATNNHVAVIVSGLNYQHDVYLVDCGCGFPTFHAISLNLAESEESPLFKDSFLEYKYVRYKGKVLRMHGNGDSIKHNDSPVENLDFFLGRFRRFYEFDPDQKLDGPDKPVGDAYDTVAAGLTPFTFSPRAVWFPKKQAIVIVNNKLMVENEAGELVTTLLKSDEDILKAYNDYFPQLNQDMVSRALEQWHHVTK